MKKDIRRRGFTITELMIASSISLFVCASLAGTIFGLSKSVLVSTDETTATIENLSFVRLLQNDLRGVSEVVSKSNTSFRFITTDKFGNEKEIAYRIDSDDGKKSFIRNEISGDNIDRVLLAHEEQGLVDASFTYYTQRGLTPNTAEDTNAIEITIEREIETVHGNINRDVDISMIMFRNKMYNL